MMIRKNRRQRLPRLSKNLERLFKEKKCRKCSVVVTRMDFAKILGKFTKVKIQYESASPPNKRVSLPTAKVKDSLITSPNSNARLKSNENGMVLLPRTAYNEHPAKDLKSNRNKTASPKASNVLKENNRLKKTVAKPKNIVFSKKALDSNLKQYKIVFKDPKNSNAKDMKSKITLPQLLPSINVNILPSKEWCIDFFPKNVESKDEKVYDRITAELEDLMNNDKPKADYNCVNTIKTDEFPSIMDILNDTTGVQSTSTTYEIKNTLESSDVEAMLLGNTSEPTETQTNNTNTSSEQVAATTDISQENMSEELTNTSAETVSKPMEVDTDILESEAKISENTNSSKILANLDNPGSPSILNDGDEQQQSEKIPLEVEKSKQVEVELKKEVEKPSLNNNNSIVSDPDSVTFVIFKKSLNGKCYKSVTCTKNLKYTIEIEGKSVEFLGAPKYVSCLEDIKVLLQIVHESELQSLYVLH